MTVQDSFDNVHIALCGMERKLLVECPKLSNLYRILIELNVEARHIYELSLTTTISPDGTTRVQQDTPRV